MRVRSFLCSDSLVYTSFFSFLFYTVFIHVIVHAGSLLQAARLVQSMELTDKNDFGKSCHNKYGKH